LLRREGCTTLNVTTLAPTINVLFSTEEKHRASGVANVVPPMVGGNSKVNDSLAAR
jgi:hypothetical protein